MLLAEKTFAAATAGLLCHWALFINGEWHLHVKLLLELYTFAFLGLCATEYLIEKVTIGEVPWNVFVIVGGYNAALFTSITVYRLFFHRLRQFPGPRLARITKFWHVWQCRSSRNHLVLEGLRERYGNFIRTGPNELTIIDPAIMPIIQDTRKYGFTKPEWYDFLYPYMGVVSIRDIETHTVRRRIWDHGFTIKAISDYEGRIARYAEQLENYIASSIGQPFDANKWFHWMSFDIMGDLAFAKSFDNLIKARWHEGPRVIREGMSLLGIASPVPWLAQLAFQVPILPQVRGWNRMTEFCKASMEDRLKVEPETRDISSALIEGSVHAGTLEQDADFLTGDAITAIIAGSDTTALTLTDLFYRLCRHAKEQEKLFNELKVLESVYDHHVLRNLPQLNAVINETLRLHPAVPTGGLRRTPSEGVHVKGVYLPGDVTVCIPQYSMSRSPECFKDPVDFRPERWTTHPELIKDKSAFSPFGTGKFNCVGKNLGLSELRFVTALLISKYRVTFIEGDDGSEVLEEMRDNFINVPGPLSILFHPRGGLRN